jgi:hypothetical protein
MYAKKFVFTASTMPMLVFFHQAADFQKRRSNDKDNETKRR